MYFNDFEAGFIIVSNFFCHLCFWKKKTNSLMYRVTKLQKGHL